MKKIMNRETYDLIIIGGGPAGLTAGLYAARAKLKTLLLEKLPLTGGQTINAWMLENYPGFPDGISGPELMKKMETQARKFGLMIKTGEVNEIKVSGDMKQVVHEEGDYFCRTIIVATGTSPSRLGVKGEKHLIGKGISFCGTCDGFFFKDKDVVLVGGGDTADVAARAGDVDEMTFVSTGGGASLKLIEGEELPGIIALQS